MLYTSSFPFSSEIGSDRNKLYFNPLVLSYRGKCFMGEVIAFRLLRWQSFKHLSSMSMKKALRVILIIRESHECIAYHKVQFICCSTPQTHFKRKSELLLGQLFRPSGDLMQESNCLNYSASN